MRMARNVGSPVVADEQKQGCQLATTPPDQLTARMLVGTPVSPRHHYPILPYGDHPCFPLANGFLVLHVARTGFRRRPAALRDSDHLECVWQSVANHLDVVADFDALPGRCPLAIDFDVPAGHGSRRQAPGLEEPAEKQPAIYA